jgi:hypothetical protein
VPIYKQGVITVKLKEHLLINVVGGLIAAAVWAFGVWLWTQF